MNWTNVRLIMGREVRDQLRDRRTLFMIFVLPLLLYPLLGMGFFQVAQFVREHATTVLVVGGDRLPTQPPLLGEGGFDLRWFGGPEQQRLLPVEQLADDETTTEATVETLARQWLIEGRCELVVYFPPDFSERLTAFREGLEARQAGSDTPAPEVPSPKLFYNTAKEKSQIAFVRTSEVLDRWREDIGKQNLDTLRVDAHAAQPFPLERVDVADARQRDAVLWSKIFPFLLLIWALTGAFYPAVDLCAGEKERGTLETLLSSAAERNEIVWGKLLTVMLFSMATVIFNLLSTTVTGYLILSQLPNIGPPPVSTLAWLFVALIPVSALFSALCLALASFARSNKEGQYYLMPLVLVAMPLVVLPMSPGVELNLGNSLIPLTGLVLLLRGLVEGDYAHVLPFVPPVLGVMAVCCWLAIRWAIDQFNSESVLFRDGERMELGLWMRHLLRDRQDTPNVATAVACGVVILVVRFFMGFAVSPPATFAGFMNLALVSQLAVILTPALLFTVMLTRSPRKTLQLNLPRPRYLLAAAILALAVHPVVSALQELLLRLYPINDQIAAQLSGMLSQPTSPWLALLAVAVVPGICEELAFRGFILSGLRHMGHRWQAIVLSAVFFGMTHAILQQTLLASVVGVVLGFLVVQTGSIFPAIVFHVSHNALALVSTWMRPAELDSRPELAWLYRTAAEVALGYQWTVVAAGACTAAAILFWLARQPRRRSREEAVQEAIDHGRGRRCHQLA